MTTNSIRTIVRRFVQDTDSTHYHWTDADIKANIQLAIVELHKIRPETRYVNGSLSDGVSLPTADTDVIKIESRFEEALADYAAHLCYLDDVTDPVSSQLAEAFLQKFMARAMT